MSAAGVWAKLRLAHTPAAETFSTLSLVILRKAMTRQIAERIREFNAGRSPDTLALKYRKMRADAFSFLRGTCHLFYQDWPGTAELNDAPRTWLCGDLHLENFGAYKADDRSVHFDVNDFDEAALAPVTWDLARFITSLYVALAALEVDRADTEALVTRLLKSYAGALADGQAQQVDPDHAHGPIGELVRGLHGRLRTAYLDANTRVSGGERLFQTDGVHLLAASAADRQQVTQMMAEHAQGQGHPGFFKVIDIARRAAGTSSLGLKRWAILVEGKGSPDDNTVLELKEEPGSALEPYLKNQPQPRWRSEAERVTTAQRYCQAAPPARLAALEAGGSAFVLRELQLGQDRVEIASLLKHHHELGQVVTSMAQVAAWGELRSAGQAGAAGAEALADFGRGAKWVDPVTSYARYYAAQVAADYLEYAAAYDKGEIETGN